MDKQIDVLRARIDDIDRNLLSLLIERLEISAQLGQLKREQQLPVNDQDREDSIIRTLTRKGKEKLTEDQIRRVFERIFEMSKSRQG